MSERNGSEPPWRSATQDPQVAALEAELAGMARRLERRVEPGRSAMTAAVAVVAIVGGLLLPWVGSDAGWAIFTGVAHHGPLPRLFTFTAVAFGVLTSSLTLTTRLWPLAWLSALGCGIATINGLWAIWSRQSAGLAEAPGIGAGMVLAVLGVLVLTFTWAGVTLRR